MTTNIFITGLQELRRRAQEAMEAARLQYLQRQAVKKSAEQLLPPPAIPINELLKQRVPDIRSLLRNPKPTGRRDVTEQPLAPYALPFIERTTVATEPADNYLFGSPSAGFEAVLTAYIWNRLNSAFSTYVLFESTKNTKRSGTNSPPPTAENPLQSREGLVEAADMSVVSQEQIGGGITPPDEPAFQENHDVYISRIHDVVRHEPIVESGGPGVTIVLLGIAKYLQTHSYTYDYVYERSAFFSLPVPPGCGLGGGSRFDFESTTTNSHSTTFSVEYEYFGWTVTLSTVTPFTPSLEQQSRMRALLPDITETTRRRLFDDGSRYQNQSEWSYVGCTLTPGIDVDDDSLALAPYACGVDIVYPEP